MWDHVEVMCIHYVYSLRVNTTTTTAAAAPATTTNNNHTFYVYSALHEIKKIKTIKMIENNYNMDTSFLECTS